MKKFLFYALLFVLSHAGIAQTIVFSEDFESTTGRALPAGWSNVSTDTPGWIGCTAATISSDNYNVPSHTHFAGINDDQFNVSLPGHNNINDKLSSPSFSLASLTLPFLQFSQFFSGQYEEYATVEVSINGGVSWVTIDSLSETGMPSDWVSRQISLQQFAGQSSVMLRFGYSDGGGWGDGNSIDDVQVYQPTDYDVSADAIQLATIILNNTPIKVVVTDQGAQVITSLSMNYSISGGTPVAQTFSGLHIIPFTSDTLTFSANINGMPIDASYTVTVNAILVNGNTDANPGNNQVSKMFIVASRSVQRSTLFEECTSSTCDPCAGFAAHYDPIWLSMGADVPDSDFYVVKYQQDFPAPDDSSYNSYAGQRFGYYGTDGIPTLAMDGSLYGPVDPDICKQVPAYLTLTGDYIFNTSDDSVYITITATPHFSAVGDYRLRVVLTEDHYQNPYNLNGQLDYYNVERTMLPDATGTSVDTFADGQMKTYTFSTKVDSGVVYMGSHTFWNNPWYSHMVAFVQDDNTKEVLQAVVSAPAHPAGVKDITALNSISVYPNPANTQVYIAFNLPSAQKVSIELTDISGQIVYSSADEMRAGMQTSTIPTATLPTGLYIISIQTPEGNIVRKLNVVN